MSNWATGDNNNEEIIDFPNDNFAIAIDVTNSIIEEFNNLKVGSISWKILNII